MANFNQSPSGQATVSLGHGSLSALATSEARAATMAALMPRTRYVRPQDGRRVLLHIPEPR